MNLSEAAAVFDRVKNPRAGVEDLYDGLGDLYPGLPWDNPDALAKLLAPALAAGRVDIVVIFLAQARADGLLPDPEAVAVQLALEDVSGEILNKFITDAVAAGFINPSEAPMLELAAEAAATARRTGVSREMDAVVTEKLVAHAAEGAFASAIYWFFVIANELLLDPDVVAANVLIGAAASGNAKLLWNWPERPLAGMAGVLDAAVNSGDPDTVAAADDLVATPYMAYHLLLARGNGAVTDFLAGVVAPSSLVFTALSLADRDQVRYLLELYRGPPIDSLVRIALERVDATTAFFEVVLFAPLITPDFRRALIASTFPGDVDWDHLLDVFSDWSPTGGEEKAAYVRPLLEAAGGALNEGRARALIDANADDPGTLRALYAVYFARGALGLAVEMFGAVGADHQAAILAAALDEDVFTDFANRAGAGNHEAMHKRLIEAGQYPASTYIISLEDDDDETKAFFIDAAASTAGDPEEYLRTLLIYGAADGDEAAFKFASGLVADRRDRDNITQDVGVYAAILASPVDTIFDSGWQWVAQAGPADFADALTGVAESIDSQRALEIIEKRPADKLVVMLAAARAGNDEVLSQFAFDEPSRRLVTVAAAAAGQADIVNKYLDDASEAMVHAAAGGHGALVEMIRRWAPRADTSAAAQAAIWNGYHEIWMDIVPADLVPEHVGAVALPSVRVTAYLFLLASSSPGSNLLLTERAGPEDIARKTAAIEALVENARISGEQAAAIASVAVANGSQFAVDAIFRVIVFNPDLLAAVASVPGITYNRETLFESAVAHDVAQGNTEGFPTVIRLLAAGLVDPVPSVVAEHDALLELLFEVDEAAAANVAADIIRAAPFESILAIVAATVPKTENPVAASTILGAVEDRLNREQGKIEVFPGVFDDAAIEAEIRNIERAAASLASVLQANSEPLPIRYVPYVLCWVAENGFRVAFDSMLETYAAFLSEDIVAECMASSPFSIYAESDSRNPRFGPGFYPKLLEVAAAVGNAKLVGYLAQDPLLIAPLTVLETVVASGSRPLIRAAVTDVLRRPNLENRRKLRDAVFEAIGTNRDIAAIVERLWPAER